MSLLPYVESAKLQDRDLFLICSDGLTDMVSEEKIAQCLRSYDFLNMEENQPLVCNLMECSQQLVQMALEAGGRDNITMILIRVIMDAVPDSVKKENAACDKIDTDTKALDKKIAESFSVVI